MLVDEHEDDDAIVLLLLRSVYILCMYIYICVCVCVDGISWRGWNRFSLYLLLYYILLKRAPTGWGIMGALENTLCVCERERRGRQRQRRYDGGVKFKRKQYIYIYVCREQSRKPTNTTQRPTRKREGKRGLIHSYLSLFP